MKKNWIGHSVWEKSLIVKVGTEGWKKKKRTLYVIDNIKVNNQYKAFKRMAEE